MVGALLLTFAATSLAQAQGPHLQWEGKTYTLGECRVAADNVNQVKWSRDGRDVAYVRRVGDHSELGAYNLELFRGGPVATVPKEEKLDWYEWLSGSHKLLVATRRPLDNRPVPTELISLRVADAQDLKTRTLWSQELPVADGADLEVDASPTLCHAIVTLTAHGVKRFLVVTEGAGAVQESADLERADRQGLDLAGWSIDGTGIFAPLSLQDLFSGPIQVSADGVAATSSGSLTFTITKSETGNDTFLSGISVRLLSRPPIELGASTQECIPSNGALRQIRFPGYYEEPERLQSPLVPRFKESNLDYGTSSEPIKSLWLVPNLPVAPDQRSPQELAGLLVAAEAEEVWMAPSPHWFAYSCHGALFLRELRWGR